MKKAWITGVTGQDGAYMAALLLKKGYQVYGSCRNLGTEKIWRLNELGISNHPNLVMTVCDITDQNAVMQMVADIRPDEIYNLAAQSFVGLSFEQPVITGLVTGIGVVNILESIRHTDPGIRFFQASTSEMFGDAKVAPQTEQTPFCPKSPYGAAKLYAHWMAINYLQSYGIFACSGILFNHESPLRGSEFVTRKITSAVANIKLGQLDCVELGNMDAKRDWGYAKDYVEGMYQIMQARHPDNYVLATNRAVTVRHFVEMSFNAVGIKLHFEGQGIEETGINIATGKVVVRVNPAFYRASEASCLIGDASKAFKDLGWQAKTSLEEICRIMVEADLARIQAS